MEKEILNFIKRRWIQDSNWLNGNCLWFAYILNKRFPQLQIYYLPIEGHFICGVPQENEMSFFDWRGKIIIEEEPILFESIKREDINYYNRLIKDCLL